MEFMTQIRMHLWRFEMEEYTKPVYEISRKELTVIQEALKESLFITDIMCLEKLIKIRIVGFLERLTTENLFQDTDPMEIMQTDEIKKGDAKIRCCVEGKVKEYKIRITKIDKHTREENKGLEIEVTDPKLLEITGGIIQGMSGTPIIQNGKIAGAVTHVFVSDPTRGYGIFIENMLKYVE